MPDALSACRRRYDPAGMYICLCRAVSSRTIREVILAGAMTPEEVGARCAAGTVCGKCLETIQLLLDEHWREQMRSV
jgi:bacterioferritin-associated ferredoxin